MYFFAEDTYVRYIKSSITGSPHNDAITKKQNY